MPGFRVRDRPDRNSPRRSRKAGDFPARKPGEPSVTSVVRKTSSLSALAGHLKQGHCPGGPLADKADCFTDRLLASPAAAPTVLDLDTD